MKVRFFFFLILLFIASPTVAAGIDPLAIQLGEEQNPPALINMPPPEGSAPSSSFTAPVSGKLKRHFSTIEVRVLNNEKVPYLLETNVPCLTRAECIAKKRSIIQTMENSSLQLKQGAKPNSNESKATGYIYTVQVGVQQFSPYYSVHFIVAHRTLSNEALNRRLQWLKETWSR